MSEVIEKLEVKPEAKKEPPKREVQILDQRLGLAEHMRQDWVVNAEQGTSIEDLSKPSYWAHVAARLQRYDEIQVRLETGEWIADLFVVDVGRNWAKVHVKHVFKLDASGGDPVVQTHEVAFKGPQHKWTVIRLADKAFLQTGFTDRAGAEVWLKNHLNIAAT